MVGIKTTGEQISILCHNGTIFDKPREKPPRKAQNITPASLPQNNPPEGSHTITTIFTKTY
jgi:hypothetical protein